MNYQLKSRFRLLGCARETRPGRQTDLQVSAVSETLRVSSSREVRNRRAAIWFSCILKHLRNWGLPQPQFAMVLIYYTQHITHTKMTLKLQAVSARTQVKLRSFLVQPRYTRSAECLLADWLMSCTTTKTA